MALQLRRKTHESIVYIDKDSAPRIMPYGEDFILEDIPVGTRVIYPNPPIKGLPNREAAIRYAVNHPLEMEPLYALLEPGMRVTIAMDDISLPLPPMQTPDMRQTMLEVVLDMCGANGVDDIHLIIANSLHRKMTEWEMKRMVGPDIFDPKADGSEQVRAGLAEAGASGRGVVLFFGANWCRWCHRLNQVLTKDEELAGRWARDFVLVRIDANAKGPRPRNVPTLERYGRPTEGGVPILLVLGPDGRFLTMKDPESWETAADGRKDYDVAQVREFFTAWAARYRAAPPSSP